MAITRREPGASLIALLMGMGAAWQTACAQTLPSADAAQAGLAQTPAQAATTEPTQITRIQPMVDVTLTATDNANGTTTGGAPRKDLILSTAAGADVNIRGANTQVAGHWRFTSVKYARNSQPDRILPSGLLDLHSDLYRKEAGLDASLSSEQTATTVGTTPDANNTANTATTTRFSLSPFYARQFDAEASLLARLRRSWIHTSPDTGGQATGDGTRDEHTLRWERKPVPLGYGLEARYNKEPLSGSSLIRKRATASLLYAIVPELAAGPVVGRESSQYAGFSASDTIRGAQMRWRPNEHMQLNARLTHSVFGKEWELETTRKTPWTTFIFNSRREVETNANATPLSAASLGALSATPGSSGSPGGPTPVTPVAPTTPNGIGAFTPAVQANSLVAAAHESTFGRIQFTGRRDTFNIGAGLTRNTPLPLSNTSALRTKEYFFDTEVTHKLTPLSNLNGGLRWTRGVTFAATTNAATPSRDFIARVGLSTKLMPDTTATMGFKRQLTHNPSTNTSAETAAYVGLGHRF